jgi:dynactin complex subunit
MSRVPWERVADETVITATDEIKLESGIRGTVKFVGKLRGKGDTIFYGIELSSSKAKGDGTHNGTKYFQCAPYRGVFLKRGKLVHRRITSTRVPRISAEDTVSINVRGRDCTGAVKYVGVPQDRRREDDVFFGLALDVAKGNSDGVFEGVRYFRVEKNMAVFVRYNFHIEIVKRYPVTAKKSRKKKKSRARSASDSSATDSAAVSHSKDRFKEEVERQSHDTSEIDIPAAESAHDDIDYDSESSIQSESDGEFVEAPPRRGDSSALGKVSR